MSQLENLKAAVNSAKPQFSDGGVTLTHADWQAIAESAANAPAVVAIFNRPECPFVYCDTEAPHTECKEKCRHA